MSIENWEKQKKGEHDAMIRPVVYGHVLQAIAKAYPWNKHTNRPLVHNVLFEFGF